MGMWEEMSNADLLAIGALEHHMARDSRLYTIGELEVLPEDGSSRMRVLLQELNELLAVVSPSAQSMTADYWRRMATSGSRLFVVVDEESDALVAMTTLVLACSPSGVKGWIEDVSTHPDWQRRGLARTLLEFVQSWAPTDVKHVNLTTAKGPEVEGLYAGLGFTQRDTTVWRWVPPKS